MPANQRRPPGEFLRERRTARRDQLSSSDGDVRRRPGFRRPDIAARAFISTEYYTRIEQGRFTPSLPVLRQIADALELNSDERKYLLDLALATRELPARPSTALGAEGDTVAPGLLRLIDQLGDVPALVVDRRTAILAWNQPAESLFVDFATVPLRERTWAHLIFGDASFRSRFDDLDSAQDTVVAILRAWLGDLGEPAGDRALVTELCAAYPSFAAKWSEHQVRQPHDSTPIALHHPARGLVTADRVVLRNVDHPDLRVLFFSYR